MFYLLIPVPQEDHGFHKKRTMIRFEINEEKIENMEIIELGDRSKLS